jgi:hypothetical protein
MKRYGKEEKEKEKEKEEKLGVVFCSARLSVLYWDLNDILEVVLLPLRNAGLGSNKSNWNDIYIHNPI